MRSRSLLRDTITWYFYHWPRVNVKINWEDKTLLPGRIDRFTNNKRRVRSDARPKLLHTAGVDFCNIKVAFRVHAEPMDTPKTAREITPCAPRIQEMSFQIVLEHFRCAPVKSPQISVGSHVNQVNIRRLLPHAPLVKVLTVVVKDLDPVIAPVVDEHMPGLGIHRNPMHVVEVARPLVVRGRTLLAPVQE